MIDSGINDSIDVKTIIRCNNFKPLQNEVHLFITFASIH